MNNSLPDWMTTKEEYEPSSDRDYFITGSILQLMGVLARARWNPGSSRQWLSAPVRLIVTLYLIILLALSRTLFFSGCVLALLLVQLCLLPEKSLVRVLKTATGAAVLSLLLLLPSAFLGSPRAMLSLSGKVFLSVGLVNLLSVTTPWNRLTESLRFFHVPDLFIFTFDLTLKYIVILGTVCLNMLEALRLRSVGRNRQKGRAISGVLGVTFLKSRQMAEDSYNAMVCRGFEGEYTSLKRLSLRRTDLLALPLLGGFTLLFLILECGII